MFVCLASNGFGIVPEDAQRERIGEDAAVFENLVSGAMSGRGESGPAGLSDLHERSIVAFSKNAAEGVGCGPGGPPYPVT